MDRNDPLQVHRDAFNIPKRRDGSDHVYLCGQTLGLQHKDVESSVAGALKRWRELGVLAEFQHPNPWAEVDRLGRKEIAEIVGAQESEVITMNSYTVNLHLLLIAFYKPKGNRRLVMMGNYALPNNVYAVMSQLEARGLNPAEDLITVCAPKDEDGKDSPAHIPMTEYLSIIDKRGSEIAVILLSALHFITGQLVDVQAITKAAHAKGIIVGVDCAHAVGNVPLKLHEWEVDFASWCTYRYLNSGPGNLAGAFVHTKHTQVGSELKTLRGCRGHEPRDLIDPSYKFEPAEGAAGFQLSNVSVLGMMALLPSVRLIAKVGMDSLREKSLLLTSYLELLLGELVPPGSIRLLTSVDPSQRGAQLTIRILPNKLSASLTPRASYGGESESDAECMERYLRDVGIIVSTCSTDLVFLAPVPLYNTFKDVLLAARAIAECF
ncbi:kynureninase, putative [Trypanosoma brucei brucei TREU927]|uniref:Kynureninase n=4 Tax=Trypanozoon TaxID=39700 RepID=Q38FV7_TRYB2|nr:kynureninase, putative [Trypanosoma brucei brucei TREU927]EAN76313.1 kynureninase, putative [Trypanosoma brucei brucei TREU927]